MEGIEEPTFFPQLLSCWETLTASVGRDAKNPWLAFEFLSLLGSTGYETIYEVFRRERIYFFSANTTKLPKTNTYYALGQ